MLGSLRKFSGSIYAKILLGIIVIPFVFWGMGGSIVGGSKNIVVKIDSEKYSTQEFVEFIQRFSDPDKKILSSQVEGFLSAFISEKIIEQEVEYFKIKLSDDSLSKLIKQQKDFKRENEFSRLEYEKFLLKNNITASTFENNLSKHEKKKQLLDFIGGGVFPSESLVNNIYNKINQKRNIELINLNDVFKKKITFTDDQIKSYYENNRAKYIETHKSIKILELNPEKLIDSEEFNDLFFKTIDEIDDAIIEGKNLDFIVQKYNLDKGISFTFNKLGKEINLKAIDNIPKDLIKEILNLNDSDPTILIEKANKYFIVELSKIENIQKDLGDKNVKKDILLNLERNSKRKLIAEIISKINNNNFNKPDFNKLSIDENVSVQKIILENQNDNKLIKEELVNQIYLAPAKKVIVINDINLTENFLIYVDKIENVTIEKNSENYQKYQNLAKIKITSELYNTYDKLIKSKYKIDINYQTLNTVKNYFN